MQRQIFTFYYHTSSSYWQNSWVLQEDCWFRCGHSCNESVSSSITFNLQLMPFSKYSIQAKRCIILKSTGLRIWYVIIPPNILAVADCNEYFQIHYYKVPREPSSQSSGKQNQPSGSKITMLLWELSSDESSGDDSSCCIQSQKAVAQKIQPVHRCMGQTRKWTINQYFSLPHLFL